MNRCDGRECANEIDEIKVHVQWFGRITGQKCSIISSPFIWLFRFAVGVRTFNRIQWIDDLLLMVVGACCWLLRIRFTWCWRLLTTVSRWCIRLSLLLWIDYGMGKIRLPKFRYHVNIVYPLKRSICAVRSVGIKSKRSFDGGQINGDKEINVEIKTKPKTYLRPTRWKLFNFFSTRDVIIK